MKPQKRRDLQYVGVTGFTTPIQVRAAMDAMPRSTTVPRLMVGVLATSESLRIAPSSNSQRYPLPGEIPPIFPLSFDTLNLLHFHTKDEKKLSSHLSLVSLQAGRNMNGIQLNMSWPNPKVLQEWRNTRQSIIKPTVVLQCGEKAFNLVNDSPKDLADRISQYNGIVQYILIDLSCGKGKKLDVNFTLHCLDELYKKDLDISYVVAGGLSAETLPELLVPILREFPEVSIDAESPLREKTTDLLSFERMSRYIVKAYELMAEYEVAA